MYNDWKVIYYDPLSVNYKVCVIHVLMSSCHLHFQFCAALRYFATGANYLLIADCHGISKSTVCRAVKDVSEYFRRHISEYVKWPDTELEKTRNAVPFLKETKMPRCFGLVDGTHVAIGCPRGLTEDENQYFCYKGYYSINTMVCTLTFTIFKLFLF